MRTKLIVCEQLETILFHANNTQHLTHDDRKLCVSTHQIAFVQSHCEQLKAQGQHQRALRQTGNARAEPRRGCFSACKEKKRVAFFKLKLHIRIIYMLVREGQLPTEGAGFQETAPSAALLLMLVP